MEQSVPKRRHKIQTPGNYPEKDIQHVLMCLFIHYKSHVDRPGIELEPYKPDHSMNSCHVVLGGTAFFLLHLVFKLLSIIRGTALQAGRSRVRFPMVSLEFFIDIIIPVTLWPWGRLSL